MRKNLQGGTSRGSEKTPLRWCSHLLCWSNKLTRQTRGLGGHNVWLHLITSTSDDFTLSQQMRRKHPYWPICTHGIETPRTWEIHVQCRVPSGKRESRNKKHKKRVGLHLAAMSSIVIVSPWHRPFEITGLTSPLKFNPSKKSRPCPVCDM